MLQWLSFRMANAADVQTSRKQNGTVCFEEGKH